MAYTTDTLRATSGASLWLRLNEVRAVLADRVAKYQLYRTTMSELASLSDRDLSDLGLHRSMIRDVATEAAYAK